MSAILHMLRKVVNWIFPSFFFSLSFFWLALMCIEMLHLFQRVDLFIRRRSLLNCVLTCQHALHAYVLTCLRSLRAYVFTCQRPLRAYVLMCQCTLRVYVLTCQRALRAYVLVCKRAILNNVNSYIIQIC